MKKYHLLTMLTFLLAGMGCQQEEDMLQEKDKLDQQLTQALQQASAGQGERFYRLPASDDLKSFPQDPKNPVTPEKVALGKLLFHETGLAVKSKMPENMLTYSCASCHHVQAGFQANRKQGIGEGGEGFGLAGEGRQANKLCPEDSLDVQPIRSPSILNGAYQTNMLWNGQFGATGVNEGTEAAWTPGTPKENNVLGFEGLETQAIAGLGVHRLAIDTSLFFQTNYQHMFDAAFPKTGVQERYTKVTMGLAIAAYERTVLANQAPFQRWLRGESSALTQQQKQGAILFFGKAQCATCHNGPALNSMEFHALGMNDLIGADIFLSKPNSPEHRGRGGFTGRTEDNYKFKVPQLYNLKDSPFYGHGASFQSVREVVEYKNRAVSQNPLVPESQLADAFHPLRLTEEEIDQITDFIEHALYDPQLNRYAPDALPSGLAFPNNDTLSRADLGFGF